MAGVHSHPPQARLPLVVPSEHAQVQLREEQRQLRQDAQARYDGRDLQLEQQRENALQSARLIGARKEHDTKTRSANAKRPYVRKKNDALQGGLDSLEKSNKELQISLDDEKERLRAAKAWLARLAQEGPEVKNVMARKDDETYQQLLDKI